MDVLSLNQKFIRELICHYRDVPAVWKVNSPEYKNKELKRDGYDMLVKKCREYVPDADREFVKNKINSLRTSFRKEYKKYLKSKETESSVIYSPKLWYYNLLLFTVGEDQNSIDRENDSPLLFEDPGFFDLKSEPGSPPLAIPEDDSLPTPSPKERPFVETTARNSVYIIEDVYDAIGKNVAHKLRGMSQQQQIIAEKIINDVMYYGQMESLTPDAHLTFKKVTE